MLAIFRRLQLSDTLAEVEARDARIRGWLRKQSAATLARVPKLLLTHFARLGTEFVPTEAHYTVSDDAAALKRYMETGRLPQSPRRDDGGALLAGAIVGGVGVGIAARLLALAGVTAQMDPTTYGLGSAAAGLTVAAAINVLRTRFPRLVPASSSGLAIGATVAVGAVWGCAEAIVQWLAR